MASKASWLQVAAEAEANAEAADAAGDAAKARHERAIAKQARREAARLK